METPDNTGSIQEITRNPDGTFPPGVSGNPAGKPKGARHFTSIVQEALIKLGTTEKGEKIVIQKALGEKVVSMALAGNEQMIKLIWNYLDGMPKASLELEDGRTDETKEMLKEIMEKLKNEPKE